MRLLLVINFWFFVFGWGNAQADTLNQIDADGKKTGYWIYYGADKKNSVFSDTSKIEEGKYELGKKTGLWKTYHSNGKIKSEIEYFENRPKGQFNTYYENGLIEEEGNWVGTNYYGKFN